MGVAKRCPSPESGGSASGACLYVLGYTLEKKAGTAEEKRVAHEAYGDMMRAASLREDFGVGTVLHGDGVRPSAVYARNVTSLGTAAIEMDAIFAAHGGRMKSSVCHDLISFSPEESKRLSDETMIEVAKRVMDGLGYQDCPAVYVVHRDVPHAHVHLVTSRIDPLTMHAPESSRDFDRMAEEMRKAEIALGLEAGHGAYVRDVAPDGVTPIVRRATLAERRSWAREAVEDRLGSLAREFVAESGGLECYEQRRDRIVADVARYLETCHARSEEPLRADVHRLAAMEAARFEQAPDGTLRLRFHERAPEGTVREGVDDFGAPEDIDVRTVPTAVVLPVDAEWLAPDPLAGREDGTRYEREMQEVAAKHRAWIAELGDVPRSERELVAEVKADPGRPARDIVASGEAVFDTGALDRWVAERITQPEEVRALSDFAQKADRELVCLSIDTEHPLWTTRSQKKVEESVSARTSRLAGAADTLFDKAALDRAIADAQAANGWEFSAEQMRVFSALERRGVVVQGAAGGGKTGPIAEVLRRYAESTGRPIVGFTTASRAAEQLTESASIDSVNTARAQALEAHVGKEMVPRNAIVVLDETSMVSMAATDALLMRVENQNALVLTIGDEAQLANIEAGDTMRVMASAAKPLGQYRELTTVYRQKGHDVEWMRRAVARVGPAIMASDAKGVRDFWREMIARGHITFHDSKRAEVAAKAADIIECLQSGEKTIATGYSRKDCAYGNRAIREALGLTGTGRSFRMARVGETELAAGDRIVFTRNAEKRLGVLNGYTGKVTCLDRDAAGAWSVAVELDSGTTVRFNPATYNHVAHGWITTHHVAQGQGDPIAIPSINRGDTARSAHVAVTRCTEGLRVHTTMTESEFLDHLTSPQSLRPKTDVILFRELEQEFGGRDSVWSKAMRRAQANDRDPLRQAHRGFLREQRDAFDRAAPAVHAAYADRLRAIDERVDQRGAGNLRREARLECEQALRDLRSRHQPLNFIEWGGRHRGTVEHSEAVGQTVDEVHAARERDRGRSAERAQAREQARAQSQSREKKPEQKRGMSR